MKGAITFTVLDTRSTRSGLGKGRRKRDAVYERFDSSSRTVSAIVKEESGYMKHSAPSSPHKKVEERIRVLGRPEHLRFSPTQDNELG